MSINTKAIVRVTLELDAGTSAWSDEEPNLGRAFREARENVVAMLNRVFQGKGNRSDVDVVRCLKVHSVELLVSDSQEVEEA